MIFGFIKKQKIAGQEKKAFTLIEIITVLLVISIGMVGVLSLIVQNIQSQVINKDTLVAYQLAQEGVEMIRDVRDTNWRNSLPWRTQLLDGSYYMDFSNTAPQLAPASDKMYGNLKQDASGFYYNNPYPLPTGSLFSRIITLSTQGDTGMLVKSNVYWTEHGKNYVYTIEAQLYDWE